MEKRTISFKQDIRPLFRQIDIDHMEAMEVQLDDYAFMSDEANAQAVYDFVSGARQPQMPPGGPYWSQEQMDLYAQWMAGGRQP